jgi:hypothetical protein
MLLATILHEDRRHSTSTCGPTPLRVGKIRIDFETWPRPNCILDLLCWRGECAKGSAAAIKARSVECMRLSRLSFEVVLCFEV